jgi:hypothetical protein
MKRLALCAAVAGCLVVGPAGVARAQDRDKVTYLDRATRKQAEAEGSIEQESPGGIRIKTRAGVVDIPALDVRQVNYKTKNVSAYEFRQPAAREDRAARASKPAERKKALEEALQGYRELERQVKGEPNPHRYVRFKVVQVMVLLGQEDPRQMDAAVAALKAYKTDFPGGWEVAPCLKLLAKVLEEKGDLEGAGKAYEELVAVPGVPRALKQEGEILVVRMLLRGNKNAEAERRLEALAKAVSEGDPQKPYVAVYLAQSQMAQGNLGRVEGQLRAAIHASADPNLRALAYNHLGDYYRLKNQPEDAFWQYLRVEVMYNQDREENARALYHLRTLFDKVKNDPVRAEQCARKLMGKPFEGTMYQRLAAAEGKK